jgi:hypothetical protein
VDDFVDWHLVGGLTWLQLAVVAIVGEQDYRLGGNGQSVLDDIRCVVRVLWLL